MALLFQTLRLPEDNVIYEDESRNTYENILYSRDLVLPQPEEIWLLVTSSYHMTRAVAVARAAGWKVVPYPVDFRTVKGKGWLPHQLDLLGNFYDLHVALREYVGLAAYHFTGKIAFPVK